MDSRRLPRRVKVGHALAARAGVGKREWAGERAGDVLAGHAIYRVVLLYSMLRQKHPIPRTAVVQCCLCVSSTSYRASTQARAVRERDDTLGIRAFEHVLCK